MNFDFFFWAFLAVTGLYAIIGTTAALLWNRGKPLINKTGNKGNVTISVVIAARNEEENIFNCLMAVCNQNYSRENYEVIVVNDDSSDSTVSIIEKFIVKYDNLKLIHLNVTKETRSFKKKAIEAAIQCAKGDLIVTTDADCTMGSHWLNSIALFYTAHGFKMIAGPVSIAPAKSLFQKFQNLEFAALVGMGGAFLQGGFPIMCNGANLIYEKASFINVGGFKSVEQRASGDDMLLMLKFKKYFGSDKIGFLKRGDAVVYTKPVSNFSMFFHQRKRWASKSRDYKDLTIVALAGIVFITSFCLVLCAIMSFISDKFAFLFMVLLAGKSVSDFIFLFSISSFFNNKKWLWLSFPGQFFNIIYVVLIAVVSQFGGFYWKGRKLS